MSSSPRPPRRTLAAATLGVLVLSTLSVALWYVFTGVPPQRPAAANAGTAEHPVTFSLEVGRVTVSSVAPEVSEAHVEAATAEVRAALMDLYLGSFVDPERWRDGAFPDAFRVFEPGAAERARRDLNALTLGKAAARIEWVAPSVARFSLRLLLDDDNRPVTAVAGVVFAGRGHLRDGGEVSIRNGADLFLHPAEGGWRVFSYTASTEIEPVTEPSVRPSGEATGA